MNLAIFDLDNTLLDGDSDYNWGLYLVKKGYLDEGEYKEQNQKFFEEYQAGKLDIFAFAEFQFQFLKNNPRKFLNKETSISKNQIIGYILRIESGSKIIDVQSSLLMLCSIFFLSSSKPVKEIVNQDTIIKEKLYFDEILTNTITQRDFIDQKKLSTWNKNLIKIKMI